MVTTEASTPIDSTLTASAADGDVPETLSTDIPIIVLASACWDAPTRVNVHHIATRFAARGHRVLFVESTGLRGPAAGSSNDASRIRARLGNWRKGAQGVRDNLYVLSPIALPWNWPKPCRSFSMRWLAHQVSRAAGTLDFDRPVLWTFLPNFARVADAVDHRLLIYHCVDHYAANPGVDRQWVERLESQIARKADCILATSAVLADRLRTQSDTVHLLPNVADVELFSGAVNEELREPSLLHDMPRPRAVYVGNVATYRIDFDVLDTLAHQRPELHIVFIGVVGHGDVEVDSPWSRLSNRANVHAIGSVPHGELPAYLRHCDVALIPFLDNEHTRGSLPMKLWEYAAAGLPVVATDLPNFHEARDASVALLARTPDAFVQCVDRALIEPPASKQRRLDTARHHDWSARIEEMSAILSAAMTERRNA